MNILPRDIDLVVDGDDAVKLGDLLLDYLVEPVLPSTGWIADFFGRAFLHARLEWVGGINESADMPEASDFGPTAVNRLEVINWCGHEVLVPPLDLQLAVNKRRGLMDRVKLIEDFLGGEND